MCAAVSGWRRPSLPDNPDLPGGLARRALLAGALAAPFLPRGARAADLGTLALRLCWIENAQFAGSYFADQRGYYRQAGFSGVTLLPGGPSAPPTEIDLAQGKCLLGISAVDLTAAAVAQGAELQTIGALFQKSAFCLLSLAKNPISDPKAMIGRRIGVQAGNALIFETFLKLNDIDPGQVTIVPVQFDPTPLVAGQVDGWIGYVGNEPNTLRARGIAATNFLFADHNYPLVMETYVARKSSIDIDRARLKAALRAEIRGWQDNLRDPDAGAALAVNTYGKNLGLNLAIETMQSRTENTLIATAETARHGLLRISPELMARNITVLRALGNDVTVEQLFDMSLLDEIYREEPMLIHA